MALLSSLALAGGGCRGAPEPIFEPLARPLLWPAPPEPARIRLVGEITSSASLKPTRGFAETLGDFFAGAAEPSRLRGPRSLIVTPDGTRLWVADPAGRCLHQFDLERRTYRQVNEAGGTILQSPVGVCLGPEASFFVCDSEAVAIHRLRLSDGGPILTLPNPPSLRRPVALAFNESREELFVVDGAAHDVKVLDPQGRLLRVIGARGSDPGRLNFPCDITDAMGRLWISDSGNNRIQVFSYEGELLSTFGRPGDAPGHLALPKGIALDSDGHVYVVDARFENVQIFDSSGQLLLFFGDEGAGPGRFCLPSGVFIDANDRIWVCDSYNSRIQVFDYLPEVGS